jgi:hypothetical protein
MVEGERVPYLRRGFRRRRPARFSRGSQQLGNIGAGASYRPRACLTTIETLRLPT